MLANVQHRLQAVQMAVDVRVLGNVCYDGQMIAKTLAGWGRYPRSQATLYRPERYSRFSLPPHDKIIARGLGRSYGDAALNAQGAVVLSERLDRLLAFDETSGLLTADAGVSLASILEVFVPRGWFLPVTPGTKFCSLGGAIAADVHGKNHHRDGTLSAHVESLSLRLADDSELQCSPTEHAELFWATVGGMGLTGIISRVQLRLMPLPSAYMQVQHHGAANLEAILAMLADPAYDARYSVAWIDCLASGAQLGRSVLMRGEHMEAAALPAAYAADPYRVSHRQLARLPIDLPSWLLNPFTIRSFNQLYYSLQAKKGSFISHYNSFFYPLDVLGDWNRMYGQRGFSQYQCVFPSESAGVGLQQVLEALSRSRRASFLAVLKRFGAQGEGLLSFPREGYTLALDIPIAAGLGDLLAELDAMVIAHGGRVYLAKDAFLQPQSLPLMYPRLEAWRAIKQRYDPEQRFSSDLGRRLGLCA